jgi:hypothetical protein
MSWAAHFGLSEKRNTYTVLLEKPEGKREMEDLVVDGKIMLKRVLKI